MEEASPSEEETQEGVQVDNFIKTAENYSFD